MQGGQCELNPSYMKATCPRSCRLCGDDNLTGPAEVRAPPEPALLKTPLSINVFSPRFKRGLLVEWPDHRRP